MYTNDMLSKRVDLFQLISTAWRSITIMNISAIIQRASPVRPYLSIIVAGIGCELIYLFYFVGNFSLLQYGHSFQLKDLGSITNNSYSGFILFVLAFSVLFALVGLAWRDTYKGEQKGRITFILIIGFGILFAGTMIFCYPITAIDAFIYIEQSHVLITHHANPLIIPGITFASDPLMALAGQWRNVNAPYGPLGILIDAFPTLLAGKDVFLNLILLKCMFALMLIGCGWLVYTIVSEYAPKLALAALLLFAWNPLMLFEYSANGHNDVAMMLFVMLAFLAVKKEHLVLAFACIIASASIKYTTALLLPLFFCYGIVHQSSRQQRLLYLAKIIGVSALLIIFIYAPFWAGPRIFDSSFSSDNWYLSSFSVLISNIASLNISSENGKVIGRIIFAGFYLYALFLARKRLSGLTQGCALTMFMFLAFGTVKFESWYAIWGIVLMVLVPTREESIANLLFSYGAVLIAPSFAFLWIWGGRTSDMFNGINSLTYLLTFVPALLLLFGAKLQKLLSKAKESGVPYQSDTTPKYSKQLHPLRHFFLSSVILFISIAFFLSTTRTSFASNLYTTQKVVNTPTNTAVVTYHNDTARSGLNTNETILTTSNVNSNQFGKRVTYPVDGQMYAQPLFLPNVSINGSTHNIVFVATEHDSVYAFDADQTTTIAPLWKTSFLNSTTTTVPSSDLFRRYGIEDLSPEIGITSTPVIDPATDTLYVVAMTKENGSQYVYRLHALDVKTGLEKPGSPITIQGSVTGTGYDNSGNKISFNASMENQRAALLLSKGVVYISWASFGDTDPYHGWLIGYTYNGTAFQQMVTNVYNDTPNGQEGGIWMSGSGPAVDKDGNLYLMTGNGTYDLDTGGGDAGDSFIKLSTKNGLKLSDYFTPFNQSCLAAYDYDLGSGGVLLLPDQTNTAYPHLLIGGGKEGRIYVINRDSMGHYTNDPKLACGTPEADQTTIDKVLQELPASTAGSQYTAPGYWASTSGQWVYISGIDDTLKAFQLNNDTLSLTPTSKTPESFEFPGATPSISSNGNSSGTGIVWIISPPANCLYDGCTPQGPGVLRAYDAANLSNELYNSTQNSSRDQLDSYVKFSVPTVANGKVFVGTSTGLSIYGLIASPPSSGT
jgi:hypothetical protein